jgi:hypothetical protein
VLVRVLPLEDFTVCCVAREARLPFHKPVCNFLLLHQQPTLALLPLTTKQHPNTKNFHTPHTTENLATQSTIEDLSPTDIKPHKSIQNEAMNTNQPATSPTDAMASQNQPKTFLGLPRELRDHIYELVFHSELSLPVFAEKTRPSDHEGPKNPEMTTQVASKYNVIYPGSFATFGGHTAFATSSTASTTTTPATAPTGINWSKTLTGILYANKQICDEAAPHLYKSCTFLFEDLDLSKRFLETVSSANLESIRSIFIYYPDELEDVYTPDDAFVNNTVPMRQMFHLLCEQIVKTMPKIQELTIWIGKILELENEGTRVNAYERALLEFAGLAELKTTIVKKYGDVFDNSGDEDVRWEGNEYTVEGVKEMIATCDHTALDRKRKAFEEARDKECEGE